MSNQFFDDYCKGYFTDEESYNISKQILELLKGKSICDAIEILNKSKQCLFAQTFNKNQNL